MVHIFGEQKHEKAFSAILILCLCLAGCGDTSGGSGDMLTFSSDNGYSVSYPKKYTATSLGAHKRSCGFYKHNSQS